MGGLTLDRVNALLSLHDDGTLRWRLGRRGGVHAGQLAGSIGSKGHRALSIDNKMYQAHRIVWLITYGVWPAGMLDHANGDRDDNRPCNLREATASQNTSNRSGVTGVTRHKGGKFQAQIKVNRRSHYLGLFERREDALAAYREASIRLHGEFGARA